jgi:hypothetical protein
MLWVCGLRLVPLKVSADTADLRDTLRESFHSSVAWMVNSKPPVERLVAHVGNLLIHQSKLSLLETVMAQPENAAVEVLLYLIRATTVSDLGTTNSLRDDATKLLLSKIVDWPSVFESLKQDPTLFNASNPKEVTCLLTNVAFEQRVNDSMLPVIIDSLVCVLGEQSTAPEGCSACVSNLVECLILCEDAAAIEKPQKSSFGRFCEELGPRWRGSVLSTDALPMVLVSLAEMVLRYPSKLSPLSLFGAVVGNSSDYVQVDYNQETLGTATMDMVKLAFQAMSRRYSPCGALPNDDQAIQRLSPLLLLRRVPRCYYAAMATAAQPPHEDVHRLYKEVAMEVGIRIGVDASTETYTVDERRLAAEVGALLLPAEDLYQWVSLPSYVALTESLESPDAFEARLVPKIRAFRTALYSGCYVIPFADKASDVDVLLKIASCSLALLRREISSTDRGDCQEELYRLEFGCTDFLALCLQPLFEFETWDTMATTSGPRSHSKSICPALNALSLLHESLTSIALTGTDGVVSSLVDTNEGGRATEEQYSILARTCVWNSLLLVAKRCRVEHGHLQRFNAAFAARTVEWGCSGPMNKSARHPLCVSAAFQIFLALFVRSASSDGSVVTSMDGCMLDQLISWSLSVASSRRVDSSSATHEARMSAVKLLLGLLASGAVTATDDPNRRVPGQRLLEILSCVQSIAEEDPDTELQKLATASMQVLRGDGSAGYAALLIGMSTS